MENLELLPKLINFFNLHGGYWEISQHEDWNIEINWYPFINKTLMEEGIRLKRCSDLKFYIEKIEFVFKTHNIEFKF